MTGELEQLTAIQEEGYWAVVFAGHLHVLSEGAGFHRDCLLTNQRGDVLVKLLGQSGVGAFGIKPFAAGSLFRGDREEDLKRARLAIRYILHSNTVIPIPGLNSVEEVDNVAKAVAERRELDLEEKAQLESASVQAWAHLPPNYLWLKNRQYV